MAAVSGQQVLFVWAGAIHRRNGFDILGRSIPTSVITDVKTQTIAPLIFRLHQNYPNPFNPGTTIEYELAQAGDVQLTIYNLLGQRVRTLVDTWQPAGSHRVSWDGTVERGTKSVVSGLYVYELKIGKMVQRKKMLLLR